MELNHLKYVENYFKLYYGTYYNNLNKTLVGKKGSKINEVDTLCLEISKRIRSKYNDLKFVLNGKADKFIGSIINGYINNKHGQLRADYINLRSYVNQVIRNIQFINYSEKTLDMIVEDICSMLIHRYNYNKLNDGIYDEEIMSCYNVSLSGLCERIRQYVNDYVCDKVKPLTDVDNVFVEDEVIRLLLTTNEINSFDLLLGRCDKKIYEIAVKNREENKTKRLAEKPDTLEYIESRILYPTLNIELLKQIIQKIDINLRDSGLNPKEIVSGKYDSDIRTLYNEYYTESLEFSIRNNSVQRDNVPNKIKKDGKKINVPQAVSVVLTAGVLLGLLSHGAYTVGKDIRANVAKKNLTSIDTYSYPAITSIYDGTLKLTADNIIKTYDDYSKFDNLNFSYLAFYEAFNSATQDEIYVMDNMLYEIKDNLAGNSLYSDLMNELRTDSCFLDFMYDRLEDMGYTEIRDNKYYELLSAYLKAKNDHPHGNPINYLTDSQVRLLNKVKDKYEEFSEQYLVELGVLLSNQNNEELSSSVRGH